MTSEATVTVYSTPGCIQCRMTCKELERTGITYRVVDLATNPDALTYVTEELGYSQAPVVVVDDHQHWAGFRPDSIKAIAA